MTAGTKRSDSRRLRVLALATYPVEGASSRYRMVQWLEPLAARGIDVTFSPFLDPPLFDALYEPWRFIVRLPRLAGRFFRRFRDVARGKHADLVWVQREAMLFGPPLFEWLIARVLRRPMVLDLDDNTYVSYVSPVYGRFATVLKWPSKADTLIRWASSVIAGSTTVADYVTAAGGTSVVIPTIVDLTLFKPAENDHRVPVIGWIGSHGTFEYLEAILPVFARLARKHDFRLRIVGSGRESMDLPGVKTEIKPWRLDEEIRDLQSFDIGLYPVTEDRWSVGKSGFKAIQYMAVGLPFVMSPVGVCATIGIDGHSHFLARTQDEWYDRLDLLLRDATLRRAMGREARRFAEDHYDFEANADKLAGALRAMASASGMIRS